MIIHTFESKGEGRSENTKDFDEFKDCFEESIRINIWNTVLYSLEMFE